MEGSTNLKKKLVLISIFLALIPDAARAICLPRGSADFSNAPTSSPIPPPSGSDNLGPSASQDDDDSQISPSPAASGGNSDSPGLEEICNNTDYPELCISSISPFFTGPPEPLPILGMAIKAATFQARLAIAIANKMAKAAGIPRAMSTSLMDCSDNYEDAIDNLNTALEAIKHRDIGTINTMLSAVITDSWTCDEEFADKNPMAAHEQKLGNMASNCLAIASLVKF